MLVKVIEVLLKQKGNPANRQLIENHLGGNTLTAIACDPNLDDSEKLAQLNPVFTALKTGDFSQLSGAAVEPVAQPADEQPTRFNPLTEPTEGHREITLEPPIAIGRPTEDPADLLRRAIAAMAQPAKPIDKAEVEAIVAAALAGHLDTVTSNVSELLASLEKRLTESKGAVTRIEIVHPDKVVDLGTEPVHCQFKQILTWLSGNVPVWLWGKAGGGKTHLGRQLAKALDLPATIVSIDPTMTVGKLLGYRNLATGEYVQGFLRDAYENGGLLMLDEVDTGDPGILACLNALLANGHYLFPDGKTVERHPKFRVLAGGNTKGTGATAGYTARQKLDAATLNRFAIIELQYDEELEELLSLGSDTTAPKYAECKRWVTWVRKVRALVGSSVLVSPRASYLGVAALRAGVPITEVAESLVFALTTTDTKQSITSNCGLP